MFEFLTKVESVNESKEIEKLNAEMDMEIGNLMTEVEKCFERSDNQRIKSLLNRLRYYERAQKLLEKKMQ